MKSWSNKFAAIIFLKLSKWKNKDWGKVEIDLIAFKIYWQ